ncbi:hypothetical protein HPQ32_14655 [Photobacterium carnosum]|uniref:hypothetical protein n=1 Tax=Photobacterium carnosum TaxID=2023717 RepID=UPI001C9029E8|nr:hypothetical protein [Photobacterium carnosum]MBY3789662.1 hypothetical protein [Photobacterium carnosum]MCD9535129.1 hypothetical protein [Photobacterium carnosum]
MKLIHTKHKEILDKVEALKLEGYPLITKERELIDFIDDLMPDVDSDIKDQLVEYFVEGKLVDWNVYLPVLLKAVDHHLKAKC